ncbi:hypothetical protein AM587_10007608 [Phytophthora nicotianae]|uniref:Uncharacterized protein n=1 Tax=Phytophthora nicotianae TaxID=4792 RepID=A0A0W8CKR7_PHYNI|nr:hypothetical protein AM587_10007608 [Phytophthora nicotianae]
MGLTKLHGELTQCCLAEALLHVLERAATCQVDRYILISVGDTTIAEQGAVLSKLVNGFLRQNEGLISNNLIGDDYYTHADNVDELKLPLDQIASRILVVAYAPCKDEIAVQLVEEMTSKLRHSSKRSILLTLCNPVGLLGLKPDNRAIADLRMYHLSRIGKVESDSDWETNLKFIGQPLDFLQDQCGWHFVMECLTNLRKDEYWTALSYFRCCVRLAPTKMKFQRQVANTLLALQTLKTSSNSSNEAT